MQSRRLTVAVPLDEDGQPCRMFRTIERNNECKALEQLAGICTGLLADGVVSDQEARFFFDWVKRYAPNRPVWPFTDILKRLDQIFHDGVIDEEERQDLHEIIGSLCGIDDKSDPTQDRATQLPLCRPAPSPILFEDHEFSLTGKFAYGARKAVIETIDGLGGYAHTNRPTWGTHYLLIGTFASRDWVNTNSGRKIEYAVKLRGEGAKISIIAEEHWRHFLPGRS
jgi:hypothetical protein